jgi:hypothetical protein
MGKVNVNDVMAIVTYVKVKGVGTNKIEVVDIDRKSEFQVIGTDLIESMLSADQFSETKKVPLTEMATILSHSFNVPFTVEFVKKDGEARKLRGRLIHPEPILGRCSVQDLDVTDGSAIRLVDNRTLTSLIVGGVKYTIK